jgi:hypothetical protein
METSCYIVTVLLTILLSIPLDGYYSCIRWISVIILAICLIFVDGFKNKELVKYKELFDEKENLESDLRKTKKSYVSFCVSVESTIQKKFELLIRNFREDLKFDELDIQKKIIESNRITIYLYCDRVGNQGFYPFCRTSTNPYYESFGDDFFKHGTEELLLSKIWGSSQSYIPTTKELKEIKQGRMKSKFYYGKRLDTTVFKKSRAVIIIESTLSNKWLKISKKSNKVYIDDVLSKYIKELSELTEIFGNLVIESRQKKDFYKK